MEVEIKAWAYDILAAIYEIEIFFEEVSAFEVYKGDLKTRRAVERNLEIVGEAMNRILKMNPDVSFQNARKIVETRNRIIYGYDFVSDEIIWSILQPAFQPSKQKSSKFLGELNHTASPLRETRVGKKKPGAVDRVLYV